MKNFLNKCKTFLAQIYRHTISNAIVLTFMVVLFGLAVAVFDYGNKYLFVMTFGFGLIYGFCEKMVRKLL